MLTDPQLTKAGTWIPVNNASFLSQSYNGVIAYTYHSLIPLGPDGQYGLVSTGWGCSGWPAKLTKTAPVFIALLRPDSAGLAHVNTAAYISDPVTNGSSSALVADFNGDGKPDIFLAAHNECPFIAMPSTAYLSNSSGAYDKVTQNNQVMEHDAELAYFKGIPTVITITFTPGQYHPSDTFSNGQFIQDLN